MILASLWDIIRVPFGYLLDFLYDLTSNYGVAIILFAIIVKLIMMPITAKGKKSSMKMSRMTPRIKEIQEKYPNDPNKQNELLQKIYREEGVSLTGGCLWSLVPLLILIPLYNVVRYPITYMLHEGSDVIKIILETVGVNTKSAYAQMQAAPLIPQFAEAIQSALTDAGKALASSDTLAGINFTFLGIDLSKDPQFNVFAWSAYDWAHIGAFLIPVLSAGSQVLSMFISQKLNNSVVTDKNGVRDEETAKSSQANQSAKTMMWLMPLMSLWIGFSFPAAMSLYWLIQGIVSIVMDAFLTLHYRKIYDAEDAVRLQLLLEQERIEAEKERIRAERRAANPDGITENTSKKKLQQKQRNEQQAAKAAAAKEYAAKKGIITEETAEEANDVLSGIPERPFCKGRAYDPNRYSSK